MQRAFELKSCPYHGCQDTAVIKKDGYVFVCGLTCGVRGSPYSIKQCGEEMANEMAIDDWNARHKAKECDVVRDRFSLLTGGTKSDLSLARKPAQA